MVEPRSSFVDTEAIRLHYLEWENQQARGTESLQAGEQDMSDSVPIILLHGLNATADTWRLVAQRLCHYHQVIAFDQRGHGLSDKPERGYEMKTVAEDIVSGMAALGLGQVVLVGHGWGARIALILAAHHPALVSHLVLVDCPHMEPRHWPGMTRELFIRERSPQQNYVSRAAYLAAFREELRDCWSPAVEDIVLSYVREYPDGHLEDLLRHEHQRQIREALWEDRALPYYSKLTCPVLLIPAADQPQPGEEPPNRLENAAEFAAAKGYIAAQVARTIPRCTVLWMPNTLHDIQLHRPEVLVDAINHFVR
jgi:pimeloyl-ACP methyl ester carboxylesterase